MSHAAASLDGAIRDGRHHMQIRVYYEDTDFPVLVISEQESPCAAMTSFVVLHDGNKLRPCIAAILA
jgi:hypothetical protein